VEDASAPRCVAVRAIRGEKIAQIWVVIAFRNALGAFGAVVTDLRSAKNAFSTPRATIPG